MNDRAHSFDSIVIGTALLIIAGILYRNHRRFLAKARQGVGVVSELLTKWDADGHPQYAPVVSFRTESGAEAICRSGMYAGPCKYDVGDQVEILYDPDNPERAEIKGWEVSVSMILMIGGIGALCAILGVLRAAGVLAS